MSISLGKRRGKKFMPNGDSGDFWIAFLGPPRRADRSKIPSAGREAKNSVLTARMNERPCCRLRYFSADRRISPGVCPVAFRITAVKYCTDEMPTRCTTSLIGRFVVINNRCAASI